MCKFKKIISLLTCAAMLTTSGLSAFAEEGAASPSASPQAAGQSAGSQEELPAETLAPAASATAGPVTQEEEAVVGAIVSTVDSAVELIKDGDNKASTELYASKNTGKYSLDIDNYEFTDLTELNDMAREKYETTNRPEWKTEQVKEKVEKNVFMTDEDFFGVWDAQTETFSKPGKLNYDYENKKHDFTLSEVFEAVKIGDYTAAKTALLAYYRNTTNYRGIAKPDVTRQNTLWTQLLMQNFHMNGNSGQSIVDNFYVTNDWNTVELDVAETVEQFRDTDNHLMPAIIIGVNKDDYEAEFYSKEAEGKDSLRAPHLEISVGGKNLSIPAREDTYISAGANAGNKYGSEERLYAREAAIETTPEGMPVNEDTKRTYLMFDLSQIKPGDKVDSAKLKLYGRYVDKSGEGRNDPSYKKFMTAVTNSGTGWTEASLHFSDTDNAISAYSYEGCTTAYWGKPEGTANPATRMDQEILRFGTWWDVMVKTYYTTKDEDIAKAAMVYLHDFIKQTYLIIGGEPGTMGEFGATNTNGGVSNDDLLFGGYQVTLDLHSRLSCIAKNIQYIYNSQLITPDIFTTFIKYIWTMSELETENAWGGSENGGNWGTASCNGLFSAIAYFPEFSDAEAWITPLHEHLNASTASMTHADGSSGELSMSYTSYGIGTALGNQQTAWDLGLDYESPDFIKERVHQLARFMMDTTGPGFTDPQYGDGGTYDRDYKDRLSFVGNWLDDKELKWAAGQKDGKKPDYTSTYYPDGKVIAMRSGWADDDLYLRTDADAADGTHSHWDDTSVIVSAYGEYLLADPLYFTYTANDLSHRWLVSSRGHNTVEINKHCQNSKQGGTMDTCLPSTGAKGDFQRVELNNAYDFTKIYEGNNYKNLYYRFDPSIAKFDPTGVKPSKDRLGQNFDPEPGMDYTRNILFVRPNFWIVSDYMNPVNRDSENTYTQYWHMPPGAGMSIDGQYELQDGEQIGSVSGELDSEIENTQYVPGTGTGAFRSNNENSANIQVVPTDISSVTPTLRRGLYSYGQGSLTNAVYGQYEKTVVGKTSMDTILFPTKQGEEYSVVPQPLETGLAEGEASAFTAHLKEEVGTRNLEYDINYYILHEADKQRAVTFGDYGTDGTMAYYEDKSANDAPRRMIAQDATYVSNENLDFKLFLSTQKVSEISVEWIDSELRLTSSKLTEQDLKNLTVYEPYKPSKVTFNGKDITKSAKYANQYVYFGSAPIAGDPGVNPPSTPKPPTGGGGGGGTGGSNHGNGGGILQPPVMPTPGPTTGPAGKPSDEFAQELGGHWAQDEISWLVDNGVVNGADGTLNLSSEITRAEYTAMILRAMGIEPAAYQGSFSDVTGEEWYAGYLQAAHNEGIFEGSYGAADPDGVLTREQAVKIMLGALATKQQIELIETPPDFADAGDISDWAVPYIATAAQMGLISGMEDGKVMPKGSAIREQAMVMVYRMLQKQQEEHDVEGKEPDPAPSGELGSDQDNDNE